MEYSLTIIYCTCSEEHEKVMVNSDLYIVVRMFCDEFFKFCGMYIINE